MGCTIHNLTYLENIRCVCMTIRPFLGGIGVWLSDPSHPEELVSEEINGQGFWPFFVSLCMAEVLFYQEPTLLNAPLQDAKVFFFSAPGDKLWVESFYLPLSILGSSLPLGWELHFWWGAGESLHSCCLCQFWCLAGVFEVQHILLVLVRLHKLRFEHPLYITVWGGTEINKLHISVPSRFFLLEPSKCCAFIGKEKNLLPLRAHLF